MRTAMQQLIDAIEKKIHDLDSLIKPDVTVKPEIKCLKKILSEAIEIRDTVEKEQIINARQDGYESTCAEYGETPMCYLDGSHDQYYEQTYGNENS